MGFESEYDVLLDDFDEGLKADEVRTVFDELKRELVPLIAQIAENADRVDDSSLHGDFPIEKQRGFALEVLERFGFDHESWRLDPTVHPFAMSAGTKDIRLTTRYDETDLSVSLFATIHEFGHGFYEANADPAFERTSLSSVTSMSLHESQSRMWENLVGRGLPAWRFFYPRLQAAFPAQFGDVELDEYYGAINKVQPSLIRVEADEATYNLHIILRFELEQEILSGELPLADLPEAWNARMAEYLGIDVPDDAQGVLQDVHWSGGAIGYFPTYCARERDLGAALGQASRRAAGSRLPVRAAVSSASSRAGSARTSTSTAASTRRRRCSTESSAARWTRARTSGTSRRSSARSTAFPSKPAPRPDLSSVSRESLGVELRLRPLRRARGCAGRSRGLARAGDRISSRSVFVSFFFAIVASSEAARFSTGASHAMSLTLKSRAVDALHADQRLVHRRRSQVDGSPAMRSIRSAACSGVDG